MRQKWLILCIAAVLAVGLLAMFGLALNVGLAQGTQGSWLNLQIDISPDEVAVGQGFLTTLVLRNEGTEPTTVDAVTAQLPTGTSYVGQAVDSDVADAAEVSSAGLRWTGPFALPAGAELKICYWAIAGSQASPGQYSIRVAALGGEQSPISVELPLTLLATPAQEISSTQLPRVETAPAQPSAVSISKEAEPSLVKAGSSVAYTITFYNSGGSPVTLDTIRDWLPAGFQYVGIAYGSQVMAGPSDAEAPEIVWTGSFGVPAQGTLVLRYWVWVPLKVWDDTVPYTNSVTAHHDNTTIGPAQADVMIQVYKLRVPVVFRDYTFPYFTVTKSASPTSVIQKGEVVYTVQLSNGGDDPGVLKTIEDTLPTGFVFKSTVSGPSGLSSPPPGATGKIVWSKVGGLTVPANSSVTLVYKVEASNTPGNYPNSATATTLVGRPPDKPATAVVEVTPPILLQDTFDANADRWTPFVNNSRLDPGQWFWVPNVGLEGGTYVHGMFAVPDKEAHDALSMYLEGQAQTWTDYRYEAWVWLDPTTFRTTQLGIWFRGNYQESTTPNQWVLGYYFSLYPLSNRVSFWQSQTPIDCIEDTCVVPEWQYNFSNPMPLASAPYALGSLWTGKWHKLAVEVRGSGAEGGVNMKAYVDDKLALEFTDTQGTMIDHGTVGLVCYKAVWIRWDNILVTPLD